LDRNDRPQWIGTGGQLGSESVAKLPRNMQGELINGKNPLENYSLEKLLDRAWTFEVEYTKEEAISIIKNWKDEESAARLLNESKDDIKRLNSKMNDFEKYLKRNSFEDRNIFKKYKGLDRWNDSNVVMDRLNSQSLQ